MVGITRQIGLTSPQDSCDKLSSGSGGAETDIFLRLMDPPVSRKEFWHWLYEASQPKWQQTPTFLHA